MRYYVITRYKIRNYEQFKAEFDKALPQLPQWGFTRTWLDRNVDDPNELVVMHECDNLERAHEFYDSKEYHQCIKQAGVKGKPNVTFMEELTRAPVTA